MIFRTAFKISATVLAHQQPQLLYSWQECAINCITHPGFLSE
jgi:hypothetical protein